MESKARAKPAAAQYRDNRPPIATAMRPAGSNGKYCHEPANNWRQWEMDPG